MDRVFHYRWIGRGAILAVKNMNVPPADDSRASKRAMSSSRDSYLKLTGRVVLFSRPYPLTQNIIILLVYDYGKMSPAPTFSLICPGDW